MLQSYRACGSPQRRELLVLEFTTSICNTVATALVEFLLQMLRFLFQLLALAVLQPILFPQTHSRLFPCYSWDFKQQQQLHGYPTLMAEAKICLQKEKYSWDGAFLEHPAFTSASLKHISPSRKDWVKSALQNKDFTKLRGDESPRAAAMEQQSQLVTPSPSSAAAESRTCLHTSANFKWFYNQFARKKKKGTSSFSLTAWKQVEKSEWQRSADDTY